MNLLFGQPPHTVITPGATVSGIVNEATLRQEENSGDDDQNKFDGVEPGSKQVR